MPGLVPQALSSGSGFKARRDRSDWIIASFAFDFLLEFSRIRPVASPEGWCHFQAAGEVREFRPSAGLSAFEALVVRGPWNGRSR
jgi:hypothetical protein